MLQLKNIARPLVGSLSRALGATVSGGEMAHFMYAPWMTSHRQQSQQHQSLSVTKRSFSTLEDQRSNIDAKTFEQLQKPFWTKPQIIQTDDGREMLAFRTGYHPKLKPRLVKSRISALKTYEGKERNIEYSKYKLNLLCQLAAGLPVEEAVKQLKFQKKKTAPLVSKVIQRTANLADIRHKIQPSALEVAECFSTRGTPIKDIKIMGRGRMGRMEHPRSHMRVVLREIDFQLKIYQARTTEEKMYWYKLQLKAEEDARLVAAEKEEEERLEREDAQRQKERDAENN